MIINCGDLLTGAVLTLHSTDARSTDGHPLCIVAFDVQSARSKFTRWQRARPHE